jgi:hypothetical protein
VVIAVSLLPEAAHADIRATRRGTRHAGLPCEDSHKQLLSSAIKCAVLSAWEAV